MKKVIMAVAAAMVISLSLSSCKSKADQMIDDMENLVEKIEEVKASGDQAKALELLGDFAKLGEKYKDLNEEDFTDAQKARIKELQKKLDF